MKGLHKGLLILLVTAMLLAVVSPVQAGGWAQGDDPPPASWWQRWWARFWQRDETPAAATPTPTPRPSWPVIQVRSLDQAENLPDELPPGQRVQVYASAADLGNLLAAYMASPSAARNGLLTAALSLGEGQLSAAGTMTRKVLEENEAPLWFIRGETLAVEVRAGFQTAACVPQVQLQRLRINNVVIPVSLVNRPLNEALAREWPASLCLEEITLTPEGLWLTGYRR